MNPIKKLIFVLLFFCANPVFAATSTVTISGSQFSPNTVTINAGDTVEWVNNDPFAHTTSSDQSGLWDSTLQQGNVFAHTFGDAGSYSYHCKIHPSMTATVEVRPLVPTCIPPQVLQGNVCVTPPPQCIPPQVLQGDVCVTPPLTCTAPQVPENDICVTPPPIASIVRMQTSKGLIDVRLFDTEAPLTVANFLKYIDAKAYNNSFFHLSHSTPNFIVQGGRFVWAKKKKLVRPIVTFPSVVNEFSSSLSNLRGTIAMAKSGNNPDSATSQWFFNLADNSATLDVQKGGFTVFGQVSEKSMLVVDAIGALPIGDASQLNNVKNVKKISAGLKKLPLAAPLKKASLQSSNLVLINSVTSNRNGSTASDPDRLFAYLESLYPELLSPANALTPADSGSFTATDGSYYRCYLSTGTCIATSNGTLYYQDSSKQITALGSVLDLLALAVAAGY